MTLRLIFHSKSQFGILYDIEIIGLIVFLFAPHRILRTILFVQSSSATIAHVPQIRYNSAFSILCLIWFHRIVPEVSNVLSYLLLSDRFCSVDTA